MEVQFSMVQNSTGGGLNALVLRAWYVDGEGNQVTIKSEVKTDLTLDQCFTEMQNFVQTNNVVE
jgi:hypothetical protein